MSTSIEGLEDSFDNEKAEEMLNLSLGKITYTSELVRKSMYDFDLETPEGIEKLMALLPIMDPEILKDIMTEIWPGYPTDVDARKHRLEIKGFLKDYLESYDQEDAGIELGAEAASGAEEGMGEAPQSSPGGAAADGPTATAGEAGTPEEAPGAGTAEQTEVAETPGA